ncbi:MAG: GNAT family N-acetyltransferase [Candidatus Hodarchaeota archaeon]
MLCNRQFIRFEAQNHVNIGGFCIFLIGYEFLLFCMIDLKQEISNPITPRAYFLKNSNISETGDQMTKSIHPQDHSKMKIRAGIIEDADRLNEIEQACFSSELRYGPSVLAILLSMTPIYTVLTVRFADNPKIIAFAIGEQDDTDQFLGRIVTIQVDPSFWSKGIGKKLLLKLEEDLHKKHGIERFELQVHHKNERAITFYQNNGYKVARLIKNYYERKEHAYSMEKNCSSRKK